MSRGQFRDPPVTGGEAAPPSVLGPADQSARVWKQRVYGHVKRCYLNPGDYPIPTLACQLADKWLEVGPELPASMSELRVAIHGFLSSFHTQPRDVGRDDLFDLAALRRRHLDCWEIALVDAQRQSRTDTPYRRAVYLFALLRRINHDTPGVLHPEVVTRLEHETRVRHIRREGEPELTPEEAERLRAAALRVVKEALAAHKRPHPLEVPSADVAIALHILLSLGTGEPPEVLRRLRVEDVVATPIPGRDEELRHLEPGAILAALVRRRGVQSFWVQFVKARAAERYEQVYSRRDEAVFKPLSALITLTAHAREVSGLGNLWLIKHNGEIIEPPWQEKPMTLRAWINRNLPGGAEPGEAGGIGFSPPLRFSRLRKSVTTEEALADPAHYLRSRRRHTAQTFFQHYTNSRVLRAEAGRILMQAVAELFDTAVLGPTVVTPASEELLAAGQQAPTIDRDTADQLLAGALDTGVAACRDPRSSPHALPGDLCSLSTTGDCYACPNALITRHHLPAVLRLRELTDPSKAADAVFWRKRWKPIHDFITHVILPAFPPDAIDQAREHTHTVLLDAGLLNDLGGADAPA